MTTEPTDRTAESPDDQGDTMPGRVGPERTDWSPPEQRQPTGHRVGVRLAAVPEAARAARAFAHAACVQWQLQDLQDSLRLVVSELVTNAVAHTQSQVVRLHLELQSGRVLIEVEDAEGRLPYMRDNLLDETSGRGLVLIDALCTEWGSRAASAGKVVWAHLPLPEPEPSSESERQVG